MILTLYCIWRERKIFLLSEIFFPSDVISMKRIYYRYNCYIGIMMTG